MIAETQGNVLTAVVIVMIVVLAALGFRTSMLVGMAIPFFLSFLPSNNDGYWRRI